MTKSNKIILVILAGYLVIMLIIFLPGYLKNKHDKIYILSDTFVKIKYENGKWSNITDNDDYKLKEFEIYDGESYKGKYKLLFTNRFYLYDNGKDVSYTGPLFAYSSNIGFSVKAFASNDEVLEDDKIYISDLLTSLGLDTTYEFDLFQRQTIDVDNDGNLEKVYSISNFYTESTASKVFSIVFMVKDNKNYVIEKVITTPDKIYDEASFMIKQVIDIKNDNKLELLLTKNYYSRPQDECALLYDLSGKRKLIHNFCE